MQNKGDYNIPNSMSGLDLINSNSLNYLQSILGFLSLCINKFNTDWFPILRRCDLKINNKKMN